MRDTELNDELGGDDFVLLAMSLEPVQPPAAVKESIFAAIEQQKKDFHHVPAVTDSWRPHVIPGIVVKELSIDHDAQRAMFLMRIAPNTRVPLHAHDVNEECYVLEGDFEIRGKRYVAGDFLRANKGSAHGPLVTHGGCVVLLSTSLSEYQVAIGAA